MTYNPNQLDPPEPDPRGLVVCEGCGETIHMDDAVNVGSDTLQFWLCANSISCAHEYARGLVWNTTMLYE